ncbi:hypothetical protein [Kitasatospora cheerisanensis]|uniref:Uncharacterized protein n=1 Tax=Kitasatospora cheerisanensis KCTC 2395 TaxID=1348663 RepID=A0A066YT23_9ACTN|nr:hypothetical protein [Kitasatospora cheerisanensis]KDN81085.1 hypothetical protein KCH_71790 [Kitasatospora cheerisanensis KCTC 2395]
MSARAECYSADPALHNNHLWHLDLLARAGRVPDLEHLALTDRHALRRLTRLLRDRAADNQRPPLNRPAAQGPSATTEPGRSG